MRHHRVYALGWRLSNHRAAFMELDTHHKHMAAVVGADDATLWDTFLGADMARRLSPIRGVEVIPLDITVADQYA